MLCPIPENQAMDDQCEVIPRDILCCKLCSEEYKHPKCLPCLHSFCRKCLVEHKNKTIDEDGYFPCPICATEIEQSEPSFRDLPDNVLARRLSGTISTVGKQKIEKLCRFCKNAGKFMDAVSHCVNCDDLMCPACTTTHQEQEETTSHKMETLEEYEAHSSTRPTTPNPVQVIPKCCEYFDQYDIGALFCVDCDMSVCADCHLANHGEHRCAELNAVAENFETKIKAPLDELDNDSQLLQDFLQELNVTHKAVIKQRKGLHQTVKKRTKLLCDLIHEYEALLLEEIDKRHAQNIEEVEQRRYDIEMHLASIDGVKDFTNKLLTYGSLEERVMMRKKIGKRVRELCEEPLLTDPMEPIKLKLTEPHVTVETICDMFGELTGEKRTEDSVQHVQENNEQNVLQPTPTYQQSVDSGNVSDNMDNNEIDNNELDATEMARLSESDTDMLSISNQSDNFRGVKFSEEIEETEYETENIFNLENPKREISLTSLHQECIKGIGINKQGDIIVGASSAGVQVVHVLEKRGILCGQIEVETGWNIHSVSSDGKVALSVARGDNRYKVKILSSDGTGRILSHAHLESYGINFVTADKSGRLIVASSRYPHVNKNFGKSSKSGGNVALYDNNGSLLRRITNDDFTATGLYLLEKPHCIAVDNLNNFYVADPGSHTVTGFDSNGDILFEYGNSDDETVIFQGPDIVCTDRLGNVIVTDRREGRIDILTSEGHLKKSFYTEDCPKFVATTPDKLLMTATGDGTIKFYDYL